MFQTIGFIEVVVFYFAYFLKLFLQRKRGIKTNQLGFGKKLKKTIIIEILLKIFTSIIVIIMLISVAINTGLSQTTMWKITGILLVMIGTVLFILAMITMKDSWRAGIPADDKTEMVTGGIYGLSRNPAFLCFDLTYIGICLAFGNPILIGVAVITIFLIHLQILEEEKFLYKNFGGSYLNYKKKVRRYFLIF